MPADKNAAAPLHDFAVSPGAGKVPGLLAVLALVPDPRKPRGRRYPLVFVLAVAAACTLARAKTFREIGDQAADLPQNVLRDLGGNRTRCGGRSSPRARPGSGRCSTSSTRRSLTRSSAAGSATWRGVLDGQVKLFAAMLHTEKTVIAQHRIPDDTTETRELEHVDLDGAVVTADAASAQRDTAAYIAGKRRRRRPGICVLPVRQGNQPKLQRAVFGAVQAGCPRDPDYTELDEGHGRIIRRSIWVTDAENIDFPHVRQAARIRRDGYDASGTPISKEIAHAVTSLGQDQASPADRASSLVFRASWGSAVMPTAEDRKRTANEERPEDWRCRSRRRRILHHRTCRWRRENRARRVRARPEPDGGGRKGHDKATPSEPTGCYPLTNGENCYEPGEYCRNSDHGASGVAGDGERIICADNDGWRWEPA